MGTTSEIGTSLCSMVCFLAAGSSSSVGAEGDVHLWELRFWQLAGGTAPWASGGTAFSVLPLSLERFSWRPPHSIKKDDEGKHRKGWLGSKGGFPFSVLEAAALEGCRAWLLTPFGSKRLGISACTTGKTAWDKGLAQKSESPGTGRRERGEVTLGFLTALSIASVAQALLLKKKKQKPFSTKINPCFILSSYYVPFLGINMENSQKKLHLFYTVCHEGHFLLYQIIRKQTHQLLGRTIMLSAALDWSRKGH